MKNPTWNREELILALDLYFRLEYGQMDGRHPEVHQLSDLLTRLNEENGFERSINSIPLKLANFKRFDPQYGGKGMKAGSKQEEQIWNEFAGNKKLLKETADKIRTRIRKENVQNRKKKFASWLEQTGKSDGETYQERTVRNYTNQIERSIQKEFSVNIEEEEEGLYGIREYEKLKQIEKKLEEGGDSKRRKDLRSAFQSYLRFVKNENEYNDPEEVPEEYSSRTEGGKKIFLSRKAERDARLKNQAIAIHGTICRACGFDFEKKYGAWGEGFIEVHHLIPLGGKKSTLRETNPEKDLTVLCANCHRMTHRKKDTVLSLEELKQKIQAVKSR